MARPSEPTDERKQVEDLRPAPRNPDFRTRRLTAPPPLPQKVSKDVNAASDEKKEELEGAESFYHPYSYYSYYTYPSSYYYPSYSYNYYPYSYYNNYWW